MKCQNCGIALEDGVLFCRECGSKVEKKILFCRECGARIDDGAKFCSECGAKTNIVNKPLAEPPHVKKAKVAEKAPVAEGEQEKKPVRKNAPRKKGAYAKKAKSSSFGDKIKATAITAWDSMDAFFRIVTIACAVVGLLLLVAMLTHKGVAIVFSLLQIAGLVVAALMHKEIIKSSKPYLKFIILAIAIVFTVLTFMSFSWGAKELTSVQPKPTASSNSQSDESDVEQIDWKNIALSHVLPEPQSSMMEILLNSEDWLSVVISGISENDYLEYVRLCREDYGFTVESEYMDDFFWAYNQSGYYLILFYDGTSNELDINLNAPIDGDLDVDATIATNEQTEEAVDAVLSVNKDTAYSDFDANAYLGKWEVGDGEVAVPASASDYKFDDYMEAQATLEEAGFSNITTRIQYDIVWGWTSEGEVESVSIDGRTDYEKGEVFKVDAPVIITYHMKEEDDPNKPTETTSEVTEATSNNPNSSETTAAETVSEVHLTPETCPELAALLELRNPADPSVAAFARKFNGQVIEFDGCVHSLQNHGDYKTRFDVLFGAGDFDPNSMRGPNFKLTDVNYYQMNLDDDLIYGDNVRVIAKVRSYNVNNETLDLDIIKIMIRD